MITAPVRPAEHAETALLRAILDGVHPPGSALPAERELAARLGVTRPTLREVLGRLERDGWVTIRHGKPTLVNDFWTEGGLGVLGALLRFGTGLPAEFVPDVLEVRRVLAPAYTRAAVERDPAAVAALAGDVAALPDTAAALAAFDWAAQQRLSRLSGNPVYSMILNGFAGLYGQLAPVYFGIAEARAASREFYAALGRLAEAGDVGGAEGAAREVMTASIALWRRANPCAEAAQ